MKDLNKHFYSPPKGGNERGVPTSSSMSPLPVSNPSDATRPSYEDGGQEKQTSLRETFSAGVASARAGYPASGRVNQPEFRNFDRGYIETQPVGDPSGMQAYDYESASEGNNPHGTVDGSTDPAPQKRRVTPTLQPDTSASYRTNGKPV